MAMAMAMAGFCLLQAMHWRVVTGGQIIAAHPDRKLAVAIASDPTRPARSGGYFRELVRLLDGPILKAT